MQAHQPQGSDTLQVFEPTAELIYSIETVAHITHIPRHQIGVYCRYGLITPVTSPERDGWRFDEDAIRELRRIESLRNEHDISLAGLRVISGLLHEVERLREEVRSLRSM